MIRHVATLTLSALLAASSIACDKPGATERQREQQTNDQSPQERNEVNEKMQNAQSNADKELAGARNDFEKTREDYRHSRMVDLNDIDSRITDLDAKEKTATGKDKVDLDAKLPGIHSQRDAFARELRTVDRATPATWADVKANVDQSWNALKDAVDKAPGGSSLKLR